MLRLSAQPASAWQVLAVIPLLAFQLRAQGQPAPTAPDGSSPESVLFETLPVVEAATLHTQTLQEAPASITVISAKDIRTYGWRTFGEVLAAVRGFYLSYDRSYHYAGLRGFSLSGDYNTRFLVMLNGHYLTENVFSSNNFFGQDFDLDMDLVKRIEIVRGPSSALYGTNGIFATINIVTKSPVEARRLRASTETGSFGEKKVLLSSGMYLGHGVNLLVSTSVFNNGGQSLDFPEFNRPNTNFGWVRNVDGERGYHTFANLIWHDWSFTGYFGSREKLVPTGAFATLFGDRGSKILDARGFFEAVYSRDLSATRKIRWRIYYDQYRYRGRYDYPMGGALQDRRDLSAGDWVGSQVAYDFAVPRVGTLTVGGELNSDLRNLQLHYAVSPERVEYLDTNNRDIYYATFAQQQWRLSPDWSAYFGVRFDNSTEHRAFVSPRAALVYQASKSSTYKFLVGRAFRNPSNYEMFYSDRITQVANPGLHAEQGITFEVAAEHKFPKNLEGLVTLYHYRLNDLIDAVMLPNGMFQYQNVWRSRTNGLEAEMSGHPARWLETTASVALQHATDEHHVWLTNSPGCVGKLRGSVPLFHDRLRVAVATQYLSRRRTLADAEVPAFWLADLTLTTHALRPDFDVQFGVRNLFDRAYYDPAGITLIQDRLLQDGRSIFLKLIWRTRE